LKKIIVANAFFEYFKYFIILSCLLLFLKLQLVGEECGAYNEDAALDVW